MIKYEDIKVPEELYFYMLRIKYGYMTKNRDIIVSDKVMFKGDFWYDNYMLQDTDDIIKTKIDICYDQVEFARNWFNNHGYKVRTYYEQMDYNLKTSHAFIAYYDDKYSKTWNWFETTWGSQVGIHKYGELNDLLRESTNKYINELLKNRRVENGDYTLWEFDIPKKHSSLNDYIDNVMDGKVLSLKKGD